MSTPSGRIALNTSGVRDMVSKGKVEAQFGSAFSGRRCEYVARRLLRWLATAVWASGSVSVQVYETTAYPTRRSASRLVARPPQSSAILRGRSDIEYAGICPSTGWIQGRGLGGSRRGGVSGQNGDAGCVHVCVFYICVYHL